MELAETFWNLIYASVVDRFGIPWSWIMQTNKNKEDADVRIIQWNKNQGFDK